MVPRGAAEPRAAEVALPLPAGRRSRTTQLVHHGRGLHDPELELLDTGVFDDDRYWSVDVTYAKAVADRGADADRAREPRPGRGDARRAADALVPQHVVLGRRARSGRGSRRRLGARRRRPPTSPATGSRRRPAPTATQPEALFCENETNAPRVFGSEATTPYPKDGINDHVVSGADDRQPGRRRHEGGAALPRDRARAAARPSCGCGSTARTEPRPSAEPTWSGGCVRRGRRRARGRRGRVLRGARAGRHRRRARCASCARPAPGSSGASRCTRTTCAAGSTATRASRRRPSRAQHGPQQRLAPPRLVRRARDAGSVGVPVVRRLGPGLPLRAVGAPRSGVREVPGARAAARVVPAPERRPAGLRVELRRRQPAGPRDGRAAGLHDRRRHATASSSSASSRSCSSTSRGGSTGRTPTATTCSAAASSGSTTSARSTARTCPRASRSSRPTARRGWPTTRSSMLVIAIVLAEENDVYLDMVIKFLEQFVLIARALDRQGLYDADDGFFYDRLVYPSGEIDAGEGADDLGPDPGAPRRRPAAPRRSRSPTSSASASRACATRWEETGGSMIGRVRETRGRAHRAPLGDRARGAPPHARGVLRRGRRSSRRTGSARSRSATRTTRTRSPASQGAWIDYEPAESTTTHVRRQLELARPDLDAGQLPGHPPVRASTSASSATTSSSSTRPARASSARSARSRRTSPTGSSRSGCPDADGRRPVYGGTEKLQTDPAWKDNLLFNEYFHGDNGAGLGADAPDRLDGARRRPDPRSARVEPGPRTHRAGRSGRTKDAPGPN